MLGGIAVAGGLALLGLYSGYRQLQRGGEAAPMSGAENVRRVVPVFAALDQDGQARGPESFRGKVWVAGFVFTRCLGPCPMITRRMLELQELLQHEQDALLVSFTVDPAGDRPEVLKAYAQSQGARAGKWFFLTGEPGEFERVIQDGFLTAVQAVEGTDQFIHGTMLAVVDRRGEIRGFYDGLAADGPQRVAARVRALLRE